MSAGCRAVSAMGSTKLLVDGNALLTLVSDEIDLLSELCNTDGMVLHARTPPNVTEHQDLDMLFPWILSGMISGGDGVASFGGHPSAEDGEVVEGDDAEAAGDDGQNEREDHGGSNASRDRLPWRGRRPQTATQDDGLRGGENSRCSMQPSEKVASGDAVGRDSMRGGPSNDHEKATKWRSVFHPSLTSSTFLSREQLPSVFALS